MVSAAGIETRAAREGRVGGLVSVDVPTCAHHSLSPAVSCGVAPRTVHRSASASRLSPRGPAPLRPKASAPGADGCSGSPRYA